MSEPSDPRALPADDRRALRRRLQAERLALPDRAELDRQLEARLESWLAGRPERIVGAYWPFRGEFDPIPVLGRWLAGGDVGPTGALTRQVGLPVVEPATKRMQFHDWRPGCPMREDAYGIPEPDGTPLVTPTLLLVPCVGFGPGGVRLGYGGGYYDRMLATVRPRPTTLGLAFAHAWLPDLTADAHDIPLDGVLTEQGPSLSRS